MKIVLYLMVASSFLAADLFSVNIKIMELSLFRISLLMLIFLMLLNYLKTNKKIKLKLNNNQSKVIRFYLFWFIYSLFSIAWVKDHTSWLRAIFFIGSGFLCIWILSTYLKKEKDFKIVFIIILVMLILHSIIGWSELLTGSYKYADLARIDRYNQFSYNPSARVPISMLGNPNDYATLLVIGFFITHMIFLNATGRKMKLLSLVIMVSSILLILRTNSRANIMGLLFGIIVYIFIRYFRRINIKTLLLIIMIPILSVFNPQLISDVFTMVSNKLHFSLSGGSDYTRLNLIKNGLHFLKETLGFGTGAGNIEYWMITEKIYYVGSIENIHNWWAEILVGYGVIIFIGYIITYFRMGKVLYYSYLNSEKKFIKNTSLGLLSIMAAFMVTSISSSSNIPTEWLWVFWGVVIAYIGYVEKGEKRYN